MLGVFGKERSRRGIILTQGPDKIVINDCGGFNYIHKLFDTPNITQKSTANKPRN